MHDVVARDRLGFSLSVRHIEGKKQGHLLGALGNWKKNPNLFEHSPLLGDGAARQDVDGTTEAVASGAHRVHSATSLRHLGDMLFYDAPCAMSGTVPPHDRRDVITTALPFVGVDADTSRFCAKR